MSIYYPFWVKVFFFFLILSSSLIVWIAPDQIITVFQITLIIVFDAPMATSIHKQQRENTIETRVEEWENGKCCGNWGEDATKVTYKNPFFCCISPSLLFRCILLNNYNATPLLPPFFLSYISLDTCTGLLKLQKIRLQFQEANLLSLLFNLSRSSQSKILFTIWEGLGGHWMTFEYF